MSSSRGPKPYGAGGSAAPLSAKQRATAAVSNARDAARPVVSRASTSAQQALHGAVGALGRLSASARGARDRRTATHAGHRPDGTPVSPSPAATPRPEAAKDGHATGGPLAALKARWSLAVQEGRLAAREKEADVRATYERRVRHDAHLHAEQHRKPLGPAAQPRSLPPASPRADEKRS